ncbi:hypothetical protein PQB76_gp014 [Arthrobacter phage Cheesy]|uniref:Tail terminator n=1 Tax=Arthrobacter phage Cheesy TaxID=2015816 RepID=A0A222ZIL3_9CAUD|nr:hypothetical protein PQB76_gp014 [Arthrobacter phage Cheesy]ASR84594.1 hypothetical protein SEA_CHEESY_14 [Arthrobacter phage Cheesy]
MDRRLLLHEILTGLGAEKVYFQPPANVSMVYPCIVYKRDSADTKFADDTSYRYTKRYMVTVITDDPDSEIPDKLAQLPLCTFNRHYVSGNLNHDVFNLYF